MKVLYLLEQIYTMEQWEEIEKKYDGVKPSGLEIEIEGSSWQVKELVNLLKQFYELK